MLIAICPVLLIDKSCWRDFRGIEVDDGSHRKKDIAHVNSDNYSRRCPLGNELSLWSFSELKQ
jgi:hypothetical protein